MECKKKGKRIGVKVKMMNQIEQKWEKTNIISQFLEKVIKQMDYKSQ